MKTHGSRERAATLLFHLQLLVKLSDKAESCISVVGDNSVDNGILHSFFYHAGSCGNGRH